VALDRNYIGSYRLLKVIRAGATCQIWEVISDIDNRRCALKTLQERFRDDKREIGLLRHEYAVGHKLHHANVIEIYDFNIARGIPYLAMEYFESSNLKQWIRQAADEPKSVLLLPGIIQDCAGALAYLHGHGWVHRDIKPDNFLVNDQAKVKLIDFAIAQKVKRGLGRLFAGRSKVQGTRSYMSPEQIRGESIDQRGDVYSFGCMLYELFCGRPPYTGGSADELLQKHLTAAIPIITTGSDLVSPEFSQLVVRMMAKDPQGRPESMQAFLDELNGIRILRARHQS
jgi:serine/threonine protein kinase